MKKLKIAYMVFALISIASQGQINFRATLDSSTITIGDQVQLTLSAFNSGKAHLFFPTSEELSRNNIQVITQRYDTTFDASGKILSYNQKTILTSFDEGIDTLSDLFIRYQYPNDSVMEYKMETLFLQVLGVDVDTTLAIKDIAGIVKVPYTFRDFLPWILLALGIVLLAFLGYYFYKRIKNKKPLIPITKVPELLPEEKALQSLEALRILGLWKKGQIKEYHTQLTDIIRTYLESQFGIFAVEMTSDQILEAYAAIRNMPQDSFAKLRQILQIADMVKFAKSEPLPNEHDMSMSNAVAFVEETARIVVEQRKTLALKKQEAEKREVVESEKNNE